jgi:putative protein kinase ArgK-like GTPase of G3E family
MVKAMERGIFIRSMASRGSLGGLAETTGMVADVLDAFGYDMVLIETVGVGQSEVDVVKATDTVVVVLVPEAGDSVQALKAGLMETADVFVVNKEVADAILKHRDFLGERLKEKRINRMVEQIENLLTKRFLNKVRQKYDIRKMFEGGNFKNPYEVLGVLEREFLD